MSEQRVQNLETVVRALRDEVRQLRDEVARLRDGRATSPSGQASEATPNRNERKLPGSSAGVSEASGRVQAGSPRIPRPHAHPRPMRSLSEGNGALGLEALIGRYGTLAVAAILVVMGVGAFVTWAATRFVIGPSARVALGALGAIALAVLGRRLAARGSVAFGSTILALALAVAHVDAWAAGPVLHVVPNAVALGAAALTSVALAALALRERNEILFTVGVGGALLAPFVTGDAGRSALQQLAYGWVVVATSLAAIRPREWRVATRLVGLGAALYTAAAIGITFGVFPDALATAAFPLACAWAAYLWGGDRQRAALSLWFVALGAGALFVLTVGDPRAELIAVAVLGTASAYVMLESRAASRVQIAWGVFAAPMAFLLCAVAASEFARPRSAVIASIWAVAAVVLARVSHGRREIHMTAAATAALGAIVLALHHRPVECVVALAVVIGVISILAIRADMPSVLLPSLIGLIVAALWSHVLLAEREAFAYPPFLTRESLAAASVVAVPLVVWRLATQDRERFGLAAALIFFSTLLLWARAELEHAIRPDIATFSLILFYAATGIVAIAAGRRWKIGSLRIGGIVLALFAAAKAIVQASGLTTIGLRVGSYLLVGFFLLAVAYWFRAASTDLLDQSGGQS